MPHFFSASHSIYAHDDDDDVYVMMMMMDGSQAMSHEQLNHSQCHSL